MNDFLEQYNKEFEYSHQCEWHNETLHAVVHPDKTFTMYIDKSGFYPEDYEPELPTNFEEWKANLQDIESWDPRKGLGSDIDEFHDFCLMELQDSTIQSLNKENEELKQEIERLKGNKL